LTLKKWFVSTIGLFAIILAILAFMLVSCGGSNDSDIYIYHFNPSARMLEPETRPLPVGNNVVEAVVDYIHIGPRSGGLLSTWPYDIAPNRSDLLQAVKIEDSVLIVFFSTIYENIPPLEQALFKTAFVLTIESLVEKSLPQITEIKILVTDDYEHAFSTLIFNMHIEESSEMLDVPWLIYDGSPGVYNDPLISSAVTVPMTFNYLHFVDETGTGLIIETYESDEVELPQEERLRYALLLLIERFKPEGAIFPIPPETMIHSVIIDGFHIFIDLSADFADRFEGDTRLARLMIYSIVNTLIYTSEADSYLLRVNFMLDARQYEYFQGVQNFDQPFARDDTLLLSYIQEREQEFWRNLH